MNTLSKGTVVRFPAQGLLPLVTWTVLDARAHHLLLEMRSGRLWWVEAWPRPEAEAVIHAHRGAT